MNLLYAILAVAVVAVGSVGECLYPCSCSSNSVLIDPLLSSSPLLRVGVFDTSYLYIAESAFATTIADTDADDVAIMSIESEGNFNQAMVTMLCGAAGVVSLPNNKDSFNEVEASLAQCKEAGDSCSAPTDCCEYKSLLL
jgi:hypothetical protein